MKNSISISVKLFLVSFGLIFLSSCSKEPVSAPEVNFELSDSELSGLSLSTYTSYGTGCSNSSTPTSSPIYSDYIDVGNGKQAKTLKTSVYNTDTHISVEAHYIATVENEDLPGQVTIDIGGTQFQYKNVNPGETVEAKLQIPNEWFGSFVDIDVKQVVFLEPAEVHVNFFIAEPCPIEVGAELMGGIVGYILQPGNEGYVEGESHGLIVSSEELGESGVMTWSDAMAAVEDLELNGYSDWTLPNGTEALNILNSLTGEFSYNPFYAHGYWTSVEVGENTALGATIQYGLISDPPIIETTSFNKSYNLLVRVVRRF